MRPGKRRTETDSSGTAGNDRVEKLDGHVTQLPPGFPGTRDSTRQQAQFTKYLTIYRKIIVSLSQDRLTIVTYNVLKLLLGLS